MPASQPYTLDSGSPYQKLYRLELSIFLLKKKNNINIYLLLSLYNEKKS